MRPGTPPKNSPSKPFSSGLMTARRNAIFAMSLASCFITSDNSLPSMMASSSARPNAWENSFDAALRSLAHSKLFIAAFTRCTCSGYFDRSLPYSLNNSLVASKLGNNFGQPIGPFGQTRRAQFWFSRRFPQAAAPDRAQKNCTGPTNGSGCFVTSTCVGCLFLACQVVPRFPFRGFMRSAAQAVSFHNALHRQRCQANVGPCSPCR